MIEVNKFNCSGCSACVWVCAHKAIEMKPDALGFLYPEVDISQCVDCGLCDRVCSFHSPSNRLSDYPKTFLMRHRDVKEVAKSKSGAAFVVLSDVILKEGGAVYGARLNSSHLVEHAYATDQEKRDEFRGSKYIQSDLNTTFPEIKSLLKSGTRVLFSGTPCQVAGLKSYIGSKLSENLILVDILCHGVASPYIWTDFIKSIEKKKGKVVRCIPRNPKYGWDNNIDTYILENGSQYNSDFFTGYVYHKWITQRWSCNACPFTSLNRVSDITLGDAWGIDKVAPEMDKDHTGCSLVMVNTVKGEKIMEDIESAITLPVDISKMMQPVMSHPTALHPKRQEFEGKYASYGYNYVRRRYLNNTLVLIKASVRRMASKVKHTFIR